MKKLAVLAAVGGLVLGVSTAKAADSLATQQVDVKASVAPYAAITDLDPINVPVTYDTEIEGYIGNAGDKFYVESNCDVSISASITDLTDGNGNVVFAASANEVTAFLDDSEIGNSITQTFSVGSGPVSHTVTVDINKTANISDVAAADYTGTLTITVTPVLPD